MVRKILMVCLGNICRSPIAEAVMVHTIKKAGVSSEWFVDSAAIGPWHVGKSPDSRALDIMRKYNLPYSNRARQINDDDFYEFHYIFGMDDDNIKDLEELAPSKATANLLLLGDFGLDESERIIEDPFYDDGAERFETAYQQCVIACDAFLEAAMANKV